MKFKDYEELGRLTKRINQILINNPPAPSKTARPHKLHVKALQHLNALRNILDSALFNEYHSIDSDILASIFYNTQPPKCPLCGTPLQIAQGAFPLETCEHERKTYLFWKCPSPKCSFDTRTKEEIFQ